MKKQLILALSIAILSRALAAAQSDVVSVDSFGAVGDGMSDDTRALQAAINASVDGGTIDFGSDKTFLISGTLELKPNRSYSGTSTLIMATWAPDGAPMARLLYGSSYNVTIDGLTFDANQGYAVLHAGVQGGNALPVSGLIVRNCTFKNIKSAGRAGEHAIFVPVSFNDSIITANRFLNCSTCILVTNPDSVSITQNDFDTVAGNAISIVAYKVAPTDRRAVDVSYNTGRTITGMAIELFAAEPGANLHAPTVTHNNFSGWTQTPAPFKFGISAVVGDAARITDNTLSGGVSGYGIEVAAPRAFVGANTITGFPFGIVLEQPDLTIANNTLSEQTDTGILFSNAVPSPRAHILNNRIINARKFGIGAYPVDYGGSVISGNIIERQAGFFSTDGNDLFVGVKIDSGLKNALMVRNNRITQTASTPPAGFQFWGIGIYGPCPGTTFDQNVVESSSATPFGGGILQWYGHFTDGAIITGNKFINLGNWIDGHMRRR
jgi:nitrous oxidase accessory protein NosD